MKKEQKFWAVINYRGEVFPSAISYNRRRAIWRFINDPRCGYGDTWRKWKRAGFKCVRVLISPNESNRPADRHANLKPPSSPL